MGDKHFFKFGSPKSPHSALFIAEGEEGVISFRAEVLKSTLEANGVQITPEIERQVLAYCRDEQDAYDKEVDVMGIPPKLKALFEINKKSELLRYCRNLVLTESELYLLIHNSLQIGFTHRSKFTEFVPPHLKVLDSDISNLKNGKPDKFLKKVHSTFLERRRIHVHLFERPQQWHCFYYSYEDIDTEKKNHWKHGTHTHYVSYLWPNYRKNQVWKSFDKRSTEIPGSIHIRLIPAKFPNKPLHLPDEDLNFMDKVRNAAT